MRGIAKGMAGDRGNVFGEDGVAAGVIPVRVLVRGMA